MLKTRNIATCLVLSIITCGIYLLIWYIQLTENMSYMSKNRDFSGITVLFLTIITCGIYRIYWSYKMGKLIYQQRVENNLQAGDNSVLYLVLSILGFDMINYCIMQSDINELVDIENA